MDDDRLSELPDSLILSILSLLPITDLVATSLLSKRWKHLWTTIPSLHLRHSTNADFHKFQTFVHSALARWRAPKILKFTLHIDYLSYMSADIDSWLLFAIANQVEELHLEPNPPLHPIVFSSQSERMNRYYFAHHRLYSCSSITKLTLVSVQLGVVESVRWDRLKSLTIEVADPLTEHAITQIISGAPLLEAFKLRVGRSFEDLNIRSTSLKMLKIIMCGIGCVNKTTLRVLAPNLHTLEISGTSYTNCLFKVPSLTNAILGFQPSDYFMWHEETRARFYLSICHVQKLSLTYSCIKALLEMKKDNFVSFPNVTCLKLYPTKADGLLDVVDMFPELMILVVERNAKYLSFSLQDEEPYVVEVGACSSLVPKTSSFGLSLLRLKIIEITWNVHDASIVPVVEELLRNACVLEKMLLRIRVFLADPEAFILAREKVLSVARSSPYADVIVQRCFS